jgi:hypothetical protein
VQQNKQERESHCGERGPQKFPEMRVPLVLVDRIHVNGVHKSLRPAVIRFFI